LTEPTVSGVSARMRERIESLDAEGVLFWDGALPPPEAERVAQAFALPGDLWHCGLKLGMRGLPGAIDFVAPTWMLNRDPDPSLEATSWRLTLRACLMRSEVLRRMGRIDPAFLTLEGASLELGHRYIRRGVLMRHVPWLLPESWDEAPASLPFEDEMRFVYDRFGGFWSRWAAFRAIITGYAGPARAVRALREGTAAARPPDPAPLHAADGNSRGGDASAKITVLIPTLDRYAYLRPLLAQLADQTVPPLEVIVVDQTPLVRRDAALAEAFPGLPLRLIHREERGQCSSRNAGLELARGDAILFLDDDDEIPPDLIERHLASLRRFRADVSCGVADETGAGPLPEAFSLVRASDVFPTNNTLVHRAVLRGSGLFDLAYERGARADRDLGMRVYLAGNLMVLNPAVSVIHHHAPQGGLRAHGARVITYASSRARLTDRHLPSATEIYLARRYFTARQVRENLFRRGVSTLGIWGGRSRKLAKLLLGLVLLPDTLFRIQRRSREAAGMAKRYPQIPPFDGADRPSSEEASNRQSFDRPGSPGLGREGARS